MSLLQSSNVAQANRQLVDTYNLFATAFQPVMEPLTTTVSGLKSPNYSHPFLDALALPMPLRGERVLSDVSLKDISGVCIPYGNGFEVSLIDMNNGIIGPYLSQMQELGRLTGTFKDKLIADLLNNGQNTSYTIKDYTKSLTNYDGLATFSAAHTLDDGTVQSNYLSTGYALGYQNLLTVFNKMTAFKNSAGQPLGIMPTTLVVPPALYGQALYLTSADLISDEKGSQLTATVSNIFKGRLQVICNIYLNSDTAWYLCGEKLGGGIKPFSYYEYMSPWVTAITEPEAPSVFGRLAYQYGWTAICDAQFGPYQLVFKAVA